MRLSELPPDFHIGWYRNMPEIPATQVRLLWHSRYYDGPLDGMLLFQGKKFWFRIFRAQQIEEVRPRVDSQGLAWRDYYVRYLVIELTETQVSEEEHWHSTFSELVGPHTDYDEAGERSHVPPKQGWQSYFTLSKEKKPLDLSENPVLGWFEALWGSVPLNEIDV